MVVASQEPGTEPICGGCGAGVLTSVPTVACQSFVHVPSASIVFRNPMTTSLNAGSSLGRPMPNGFEPNVEASSLTSLFVATTPYSDALLSVIASARPCSTAATHCAAVSNRTGCAVGTALRSASFAAPDSVATFLPARSLACLMVVSPDYTTMPLAAM